MPVYEFRCLSCKKVFEEFVRSKDYKIVCPMCNALQVEKMISAVSHIGGEKGGNNTSSCSGCSSANCSSCK